MCFLCGEKVRFVRTERPKILNEVICSMVHPIKLGKNERMSFSRINEDQSKMPNLIEVQIDSYNWFLEKGLKEVLHDV